VLTGLRSQTSLIASVPGRFNAVRRDLIRFNSNETWSILSFASHRSMYSFSLRNSYV
jgi:hypothetical protein